MSQRTQAVIAELSELIYDLRVPKDRRRELAVEVGQALGVATELESPMCSEQMRLGLAAELERHLHRAKDIARGRQVPMHPARLDSFTVTVH
jgi:hypothetical protein